MTRVRPSRSPSDDGYALVLAADFTAADVRAIRRDLDPAIRARGVPAERADGFLVAVNEAMTNAVRHGGGGGRVRLWSDGDLLCEIEDHGAGFRAEAHLDRTAPPTPTPTGGLGLWLAQQASEGFDIESGPNGTTVRVTTTGLEGGLHSAGG